MEGVSIIFAAGPFLTLAQLTIQLFRFSYFTGPSLRGGMTTYQSRKRESVSIMFPAGPFLTFPPRILQFFRFSYFTGLPLRGGILTTYQSPKKRSVACEAKR